MEMKLPSILCRKSQAEFDLDDYNATELKSIARFWVGKEAATLRKAECIKALKKVFQDSKAVHEAVASLPAAQQTILGIYSRFGPTVSGAVVSAEIEARGLSEPQDKQTPGYYRSSRNDRVSKLRDKLLLISPGGYYGGYYSSWGYSSHYPEYTLHPQLEGQLPPASPVVWKSSAPPPRVQSKGFRSSAEFALELWQVADSLQAMGNWKTLKSGSLSKGSQNRLHKLVGFPTIEDQPFVPPDRECFFYELLLQLNLLDIESSQVDLPSLQKLFEQPLAMQAREWGRGWMQSLLWQDGIGLVPDRSNEYEPVRIEPSSLWKARELLVWALSCVAQSENDWLDLETFLSDLWRLTQKDTIQFYWYSYVWEPEFSRSRTKDRLKGDERQLAYWLDGAGTWAANALWVTLWSLGLVERGHSDNKAAKPCFRLTELGRLVFGAPDIEIPEQSPQTPCLTVQPNNEVIAYLNEADARQICMLARFANRSSTGGQVQKLTLSRESVYRGLESGLSAEEIQSFLTDNSKTPVPDNVQKSLWEWSGKRESLVLRTGISLAIAPPQTELPKQHTARQVGDSFYLLRSLTPVPAAKAFPNWTIQNHATSLAKVWTVTERGEFETVGHDSVSHARLSLLAEQSKQGWHITERSIGAAKNQGLTGDQMLSWFAAHLTHAMPPLLETALRSWTGRTSAYVGEIPLLQVTRPQARDAILTSPAFRPLIAGHIPPDWFLIQPGHLADVKRLLRELGITLSDTYQLAPPETAVSQRSSVSHSPKGRKRRKR
jgi:hypothetical protein